MIYGKSDWLRMLVVPFLALSILMIAGCSGCVDDKSKPDDVAKKKDEIDKKKKPNFDAIEPVVLPGLYADKAPEEDPEDEDEVKKLERRIQSRFMEVRKKNGTKLGHWISAQYQVIANNFDSRGNLTLGSVDASNRPVRIYGTDYYTNTTRPISLPKGEWKILESTAYLPRRDVKVARANIKYSLDQSGTGLSLAPNLLPFYSTRLMLPFQYHLVLLSNRPDAYNYLQMIDPVQIMEGSLSGNEFPAFYNVVNSRVGDPVPLAGHALNWTTTAYIMWDDFTPDQLNTDQQQAMIDWLHFGGQLILSGPDCLDKLQNSFLAEHLPAEFNQSRNLTQAEFEEINEYWSVPVAKNPIEKRTLTISSQNPLVGITFKPHAEAQFIENSGQLAIERQIGRGRIVVTAFSLDDTPIMNWRSFASFFNGCLLRRPARFFQMTKDSTVAFGWDGDSASIFDPLIGSTLRFVSRDLSIDGTSRRHKFEMARPGDVNKNFQTFNPGLTPSIEHEFRIANQTDFARNTEDTWHYGGYDDDQQSGTGGWNDNSGLSVAARNTLKDAAGISPPNSGFVLKMLAGYLIVLVPLNWFVFRMMGRVEWAWVAAPIIAIAGAFTVAKMASLDIGFIRSNTQVGLLELHGGYPRGHVTEYSALYTSLSTNYDVELDNLSSQSLPFAASLGPRFKPNQSLSRVMLNRSQNNRLENFQIQSNTTGMLHTEHILDVGGSVSLIRESSDTWSIDNATEIDLANVGILSRAKDSKDLQFAWVGDLAAGSNSDKLEFSATKENELYKHWGSRSPVFTSTDRTAREFWLANTNSVRDDHLVTVEQVGEFVGIEDRWIEIRQALQRRYPNDSLESFLERQINFDEFRIGFALADKKPNVNVGRMFDALTSNLKLGEGEVRLIGSSDQKLGNTEYSPKSTQTDRQTLVLVHLTPAILPAARRDINSLADIRSPRTSLDFEDDANRDNNAAPVENGNDN